jgi:hypothetical protein
MGYIGLFNWVPITEINHWSELNSSFNCFPGFKHQESLRRTESYFTPWDEKFDKSSDRFSTFVDFWEPVLRDTFGKDTGFTLQSPESRGCSKFEDVAGLQFHSVFFGPRPPADIWLQRRNMCPQSLLFVSFERPTSAACRIALWTQGDCGDGAGLFGNEPIRQRDLCWLTMEKQWLIWHTRNPTARWWLTIEFYWFLLGQRDGTFTGI